MLIKKISVLAMAVAALSATTAFAGVIPAFTSFGTLADATFGGSGIPNTAVAITAIQGVTLGLTATQRFQMPAVTNDGAGLFHATNGAFANGDNVAKWNFNFYIGGAGLSNYRYKLLGDYNSAVGNDESTYTDLSFLFTQADSLKVAGRIQNSQNLGFGTSFAQFDPGAPGQYGFILAAFNSANQEVGRSAILVEVPEPASLALVGVALLGLAGGLRRRR